ncbi:MAG: imidazole glycerol phosphate synthase subunit HisH, partial [Desulfovibrionales bacterium]|nr:imidazole glycerol phosphate synthase subunit HisH [Desulfovibrionales bacterium]
LGICLGMHLLFTQSQEGSSKGLGWISGEVIRFDFSSVSNSNALKVPHMGWNELNVLDDSSLFEGLVRNSRFYFAHSYHAVCENKQNSMGTCDYGYQFDAAVQQDNIMGVQFHPEKSHRFGMTLFRNFLGLTQC